MAKCNVEIARFEACCFLKSKHVEGYYRFFRPDSPEPVVEPEIAEAFRCWQETRPEVTDWELVRLAGFVQASSENAPDVGAVEILVALLDGDDDFRRETEA